MEISFLGKTCLTVVSSHFRWIGLPAIIIIILNLARLKNKHSSIRGKLTRILKATGKSFSDDLRNLDKEELDSKLLSLRDTIAERKTAYLAILDFMTVAATSEEDTEKKIESNSTLEATYEIYIDRITKSLKLFALNEKYQLHIEAAEAWLEHSKVTSADFLTQGRKHEEDLRTLLIKLQRTRLIRFSTSSFPKLRKL